MTLPSQDELKALLDYDPETGKLFWKERPREMFKTDRSWRTWNTRYAGQEAFTSKTKQGYQQGSICDQNLLAHRVIWVWMLGSEPDMIDHENGNRSDNRWNNLEDVSAEANAKNAAISKNNTTGVVGVSWSHVRGRFEAKITQKRQQRFLGYFDTLEEAASARRAAERQYGFHENHGRVT